MTIPCAVLQHSEPTSAAALCSSNAGRMIQTPVYYQLEARWVMLKYFCSIVPGGKV
jgi:hypothetical protein